MRHCNECTLCCRLLPIKEFAKPANARCQFQRAGKGCSIHDKPHYPRSCQLWSCVWLAGRDAEGLPRPDRAHYVIDPVPDYIEVDRHDGRPPQRIMVVQVWMDPKYPNAHRDPALRAYLELRASRDHYAALIRLDSSRAITLFPPSMCPDGRWHEIESNDSGGPEHSTAEVVDTYHAMLPR